MKEKFSSNVFHLNFTEKKYPEKPKNGMRRKKKYSPEFFSIQFLKRGKMILKTKQSPVFFFFIPFHTWKKVLLMKKMRS